MKKLQELEVSTVSQIEHLQDFHVFTGHSYDRYKKYVDSGLKEFVNNVRTNSILRENDLAGILLGYLDKDLPQIVIYQLISCFDAFLKDLKKIVNNPNIDLNDRKKLDEIRETRNVIAHKSGIVDKKYIQVAGSLARAQLGEALSVPRPYLYDAGDFLKNLVHKLVKAEMYSRT